MRPIKGIKPIFSTSLQSKKNVQEISEPKLKAKELFKSHLEYKKSMENVIRVNPSRNHKPKHFTTGENGTIALRHDYFRFVDKATDIMMTRTNN